MANIYDMADTWNAGATTFTAIKMNVTDTSSASASLLMDLQVGGVSKAAINKAGRLILTGTSSAAAYIESATQFRTGSIGIGADAAGGSALIVADATSGNIFAAIGASGLVISTASARYIGFGTTASANPDVTMFRDASDVLALRRTTNAQTFRLYGTYTDASNYERIAITRNAITVETAGTGTDDIDLALTPAGAGNVKFGTHSAIGAETVTGFITIKDAAGNSRKLAVVS